MITLFLSKGSDFTSITIKDLIKKGEHDEKEILK